MLAKNTIFSDRPVLLRDYLRGRRKPRISEQPAVNGSQTHLQPTKNRLGASDSWGLGSDLKQCRHRPSRSSCAPTIRGSLTNQEGVPNATHTQTNATRNTPTPTLPDRLLFFMSPLRVLSQRRSRERDETSGRLDAQRKLHFHETQFLSDGPTALITTPKRPALLAEQTAEL